MIARPGLYMSVKDRIQKLCVPIVKVGGAYVSVTFLGEIVRLRLAVSAGWGYFHKTQYLPPV